MRTALLPKEHGAYGQMAFPLLTALIAAGTTTAALLTMAAIVTGFLAHEPALVLLGLRGPRARRELSRAAAAWLSVLGAIAVSAGLLAVWITPAHVRWSFLLPLVPAALLVVAIATRQEKSWHAEIAVALAFSLAAVPLCLAAGVTVAVALTVAIPFALLFVAGTLAVRTVILRVRGGGDARGTARTRAAVVAVTILAPAVLAVVAASGRLPWSAVFAAEPGLLLALVVSLSTPSPARLKMIGWSLVAASSITAAIIISNV